MTRKVLIIDDDEINNYLCVRILELADFADHITTLSTVDSAIDYLAQHQNNNDELPEVIFLDINMPVKTGWDFLKEYDLIKHHIQKEIKIYMLSSSVYQQDIDKAAETQNIEGFISKPLSVDMLRELNTELL